MKNIKMFAIAALLVAVAVTSYSVSGTYAKYTSTLETQTDSARVAKWTVGQTTDIADLFRSSYEAKNAQNGETDVFAPVNVVAPGTSGEYTFKLTGNVETNYTIDATVVGVDKINTSNYAPIKYTLDGQPITDMNQDNVIDAADLALAIDGIYLETEVYAAGTVSATPHTIGWSWAIDGDDEEDTALGEAIALDDTAHTVSLSVTLTVTQSELPATE